jgi:hypothetical protein
MHSHYMLETLVADRQRELLGNAHSCRLAAEARQPSTVKLPSWWAAARPLVRLRGRATALASPTVAAG